MKKSLLALSNSIFGLTAFLLLATSTFANEAGENSTTLLVDPNVHISFNGQVAGYNDTITYCHDEEVVVTMSEVLSGEAPIDLEWTVNGEPNSATGLNAGDELFSGVLEAGTHHVQITSITDNTGATLTDVSDYAATIIVNPEPDANFSFNGEVAGYEAEFEYCANETVTVTMSEVLSGTAPFTVEWTVNEGEVQSATVSEGDTLSSEVLEAGTHNVSITSIVDANGCALADVSLYGATVTINEEPDANFSFNGEVAGYEAEFSYCANETVTVTMSEVLSGTAPFTVEWTVNDGDVQTATVSEGDTLSSEVLEAGTHNVSITSIVDANGCALADVSLYGAAVTINEEPDANFSFNGEVAGYEAEFEYCANETVTVTMSEVLSGTAPFTVEWTVNEGEVQSATVSEGDTLSSDVLEAGTHEVSITSIVDANGCALEDVSLYGATVTINEAPDADISFNGEIAGLEAEFEYCANETVTVTMSEVLSGTAPFTVEWTVNEGEVQSAEVSEGDTLFTNMLEAGTHDVSLTSIIDANGCALTDVSLYGATVTINEEAELDLGDDVTICAGEDVVLDAGDQAGDILWSDGSEEQTLTVTEAGDYSVEVINGACSATDEVSVSVDEPATAEGLEIESDEYDATFTVTNPENVVTYEWDFGDGNTTTGNSEVENHTYEETGSYTVSVTVSNETECASTTIEETIDIVTGVEELMAKEAGISLYPNPAHDQITITNKENLDVDRVQIYNATGKLVLEEINTVSEARTMNITQMDAGIYFVKVFTGKNVFDLKMIVQ